MGISRQTLHVIERYGEVEPERAKQYRAALNELRDGTETAQGEAA